MEVHCKNCGKDIHFDQPYKYHAGFGNQGFLYNEAGNLTLTWSSFDAAYELIVGEKHPWSLTLEEQKAFESALLPAPSGGNWLFLNPPRCPHCGEPIGQPIFKDIYFFRYPGSIETEDIGSGALKLKRLLKSTG